MNGSVNTYMGAQRAKNGHPEPYHVKFWNIGNEPWGAWQLGRTDLKYFMLKHNEFAKAMRAVGSLDHSDCLGLDAAER